MTVGPAGTDDGTLADGAAQAHAELVADRTLQFDLATPTPPDPPPAWLKGFGEFFSAAAPVLMWVFWIGLGAVVLLIAWYIGRELIAVRFGGKRRKAADLSQPEPEWRPDEASARTLLADADRLAAEGRFAEAAHLLLRRSIEDIDSRRPRAVRPALTSRDIADLDALPASARPAFRRIAALVEISLFGGAPVTAEAFADCRRAYEDFALPGGWSA